MKLFFFGILIGLGLWLISNEAKGQTKTENLLEGCTPYELLLEAAIRYYGEISVVQLPKDLPGTAPEFLEILLNEDTGTWTEVNAIRIGSRWWACPKRVGTNGIITYEK